MNILETRLKGCFVLEPKVYYDDRGYFMESFNMETFSEVIGSQIHFVQDNQSFSTKGVLRGLHQQIGKYAQAKLVRVLNGAVLDVTVDLRLGSPTFGEHITMEISAENRKQIFIPKGCAHGFLALSDTVEFFYKCDNYYKKGSEQGIVYNDPTLNIDWNFPENQIVFSEKDQNLPTFKELYT